MPNSLDYDESFVVDKMTNREDEENKAEAREVLKKIIKDFLSDYAQRICRNSDKFFRQGFGDDADELLGLIEEYIGYEGKDIPYDNPARVR